MATYSPRVRFCVSSAALGSTNTLRIAAALTRHRTQERRQPLRLTAASARPPPTSIATLEGSGTATGDNATPRNR